MDFKSKFMLFNGAYLSIDEVKQLYLKAFYHNLVTVFVPNDDGSYKTYPSFNFNAKDNDYYQKLGHAKCFQLINELLKERNAKYFVKTKFEGIQDRYMIANYFLETGVGIVMATTKDNFILIWPALSSDKNIAAETCKKILGLVNLLNIKNGCLQVDGIIYDDINNFREYCNLLSNSTTRKK